MRFPMIGDPLLAELVDSAMDAIIAYDGAQRVTLFNPAAERMFGIAAVEVLGGPVDRLFPEASRAESLRIIGETGQTPVEGRESGVHAHPVLSLVAMRASGDEFPLEASTARIHVGDETIRTLIARDVSERKRVEEALRTQAESLGEGAAALARLNQELARRTQALEEAMSARSRFYASMSHELRTPINAILGYTTLLLDGIYGKLEDRQAQGLQRAHKAAKHLLELVNDVLDLSKIEAGKIELSLQPVSFPGLVEDLFVTVRPMAEELGCTLRLEAVGGATVVTTDPRRVRQILLNLISNAIKYGPGRPIEVCCEKRGDGIAIAVKDHGRGIAAEDLPRIFDEFVQLKHAEQGDGTGLGLPISKRLAELLEGRLLVTSTPGEGSTFTLTLPLQPSKGVAPSARSRAA